MQQDYTVNSVVLVLAAVACLCCVAVAIMHCSDILLAACDLLIYQSHSLFVGLELFTFVHYQLQPSLTWDLTCSGANPNPSGKTYYLQFAVHSLVGVVDFLAAKHQSCTRLLSSVPNP